MSRIRSIHPGFFKDDQLVPCSPLARLLILGLGVEADDKGTFPWKPVTLKMCIFPGDNVDMDALLSELLEADAICTYEIGGRQYGAIRNFRKFQKPKTPNDVHPITDDVRIYVGLSPAISETASDEQTPFPQKGEKAIQMEDGGGKGRMEEKTIKHPPSQDEPREKSGGDLFDLIFKTFPRNPSSNRSKAGKAVSSLSEIDQSALLDAAKRFAAWFPTDCKRRGEKPEDRLRYVPHLSTWVSSEAWREAEALPVENSGPTIAMVRLDRERDAELWKSCVTVMGKPPPTDGMEWSFKAEIVEQAKAHLSQTQAA